jgi:hypothetical protein
MNVRNNNKESFPIFKLLQRKPVHHFFCGITNTLSCYWNERYLNCPKTTIRNIDLLFESSVKNLVL